MAGEVDHFLHGSSIARDDHGFVFDVLFSHECDDVFAPRTARFDVEDSHDSDKADGVLFGELENVSDGE